MDQIRYDIFLEMDLLLKIYYTFFSTQIRDVLLMRSEKKGASALFIYGKLRTLKTVLLFGLTFNQTRIHCCQQMIPLDAKFNTNKIDTEPRERKMN